MCEWGLDKVGAGPVGNRGGRPSRRPAKLPQRQGLVVEARAGAVGRRSGGTKLGSEGDIQGKQSWVALKHKGS